MEKKKFNWYLWFGFGIPFCLIYPTIDYSNRCSQTYKETLLFSEGIDIWGIIVYTSLLISISLIVMGYKQNKKGARKTH